MGILEDFGYSDDDNSSYSPDEAAESGGNTIEPQREPSLPEAIIATAKKIGINPLDLATAISYETGGTFDPWKRGPTTQWGTHRGLIQWGEPQARQYGVSEHSSIGQQLDAVGRYLVDRGVKAGMGLLDVYSAINAGRVGLYDRSDANNGGAPGTVRDKVNNQMAGHKIKAAHLLGFQNFETPEAVPAVPYQRGPDFVPGDQGRYVPPEMRGPFRAGSRAIGTIGAPTVPGMGELPIPADSDMPGVPLDNAPPIDAQLAALLKAPEPALPILDQNKGIQLDDTATNMRFASQDIPQAVPTPKVDIQPLPPIEPTVAVPVPPVETRPMPPIATQAPMVDPEPPQVPISALIDTTEGLPRTQVPVKPEPQSFMDLLKTVGAGANSVVDDLYSGSKQVLAKTVGNVTGLPLELAGALRAAIPSTSGIDRRASAENLINTGAKMREGADYMAGVSSTGDTLFQKAAALFGRNLTPMGAQTLPATGLMMAADAASQAIGTANAKPLMTKAEAERLLFPGIGNDMIGPQLGPRVSHTVMTVAGPAKLDDANYKLLGVMGAATIGAVVVPAIARKIISTKLGVRVGRDVLNAPSGVEAFSNRMDLLRTYDDSAAGLMRIAKGLGTSPKALEDLRTHFAFESGSAVRNLANAAVTTGDMQSVNFTYKVNNPILRLAQAETPELTQYMHLYHTLDQIRETERVLLTKSQATIQQTLAQGHTTVRGMNKYDINRALKAIEAGPNGQMFKDFRAAYWENQKAMRQFEANGEYATLSRTEYQEANKRRKNEIYQKNLDLENTNAGLTPVSQDFATSMQERMRFRMENEAKGTYIDSMVAQEPNFARKVTNEELEKNAKSWGPNAVTFYRRGQKEIWITDPFVADVLKMDPYMMTGAFGNFMNGSRKVVEKTTTGVFAPWFATTNLARNHLLARVSAPTGFAAPNILNTVSAVPQQLYPRMARHFSERLDDWSTGWLGSVLGPQNLQGLSTKLAQVHDQSMLAILQRGGGTHTSMFLDYGNAASQQIGNALATAPAGMARNFLEGIKTTFDALHNAPNFAFASKNMKRGKAIPETINATRELTGNHNVMGQFATRSGRPVRFVDDSEGLFGKVATKGVQTIGGITEFGRNAMPWWNATTQGMKRVGRAYLNDPAKFVAQSYKNIIMPAAALYMYNRGLGKDPNGISYNDYQMNRRSGYNSLMTMYIGIPGRPVEDGILVPMPHELATMQAMTSAALHHMTHSELFQRGDDYMRAALAMVGMDYEPSINVPLRSAEEDFSKVAKNAAKVGLIPAMPSFFTAPLGMAGIVAPEGPFGGTYQRRTDPYDKDQGMNASLELTARAIAPGVADIVGSAYAAFTHSPDVFSGLIAGGKAGARRVVEKTPIARDVIGWKPPVAGSTDVTEDLFSDKGVITKLDNYFKFRDPTNLDTEKKIGKSKEGNEFASRFLPEAPPTLSLGVLAPEPVNMLYKQFMQELHDKFRKDAISVRGKGKDPSGGIGFPSTMERYSAFTRQIKELRKVDEGNAVSWKYRLEREPELMMYLERHKVPIDNPRQVKNFLEHERQTAARQIMFTLKALEQDYQKRLGDPNFSFDKLDPNQPYMLPPDFSEGSYKPQWPVGYK